MGVGIICGGSFGTTLDQLGSKRSPIFAQGILYFFILLDQLFAGWEVMVGG